MCDAQARLKLLICWSWTNSWKYTWYTEMCCFSKIAKRSKSLHTTVQSTCTLQPHRGTLTIFPRFFLLSTILPWLFFTHKKLFCTSLSFRWLFCAHLWNSRAGKLRAVSHSAESHLYLRKICLKTNMYCVRLCSVSHSANQTSIPKLVFADLSMPVSFFVPEAMAYLNKISFLLIFKYLFLFCY